jgi:hypothetical protein
MAVAERRKVHVHETDVTDLPLGLLPAWPRSVQGDSRMPGRQRRLMGHVHRKSARAFRAIERRERTASWLQKNTRFPKGRSGGPSRVNLGDTPTMLRSICLNILRATALVACVGTASACYARGHVDVVDDHRAHEEHHEDRHEERR